MQVSSILLCSTSFFTVVPFPFLFSFLNMEIVTCNAFVIGQAQALLVVDDALCVFVDMSAFVPTRNFFDFMFDFVFLATRPGLVPPEVPIVDDDLHFLGF